MNQLTKHLVDGILNEDKKEIVALYAGGFKPPTAGHFQVVEEALDNYPEIDKFIVFVGSGVRDGIEQAESILTWEIYQNYLPMKVEITPAKKPAIAEVYSYAKSNPEKTIYWILGARDGDEGDLSDISTRTKSIDKAEDKYNNVEVKIITTPNASMSGTNARKALIANDKEAFFKFIPAKVKEKEEIFNILKPAQTEQLTEHSMGDSIDLEAQIDRLTQHMIDKGYNIEPLPSLEFIDDDHANAGDFLGKTAYYDPNAQAIVLYTHGRHPKDIARSYAHEMIHHIQNLEGRLGDLTTTNTHEDDKLNDLEAEANLKGTMTFRNWTDSLNEKKEKDPFGLNQYARELAQGLEEAIVGKKVECDNCDWSWNIKDGGDDLYTCHKCGHDNTPKQLNEGRYDKSANEFSKIVFEMFKDIHDRGDKTGEFEFSVGPNDEDIYSEEFEFDLAGVVEITDDEYEVDGGANAGFDKKGDEITPLLSVTFKIPKNPDWQRVSFDIKDVIRHELEHLTQDGLNVKPSKQMEDDKLFRDMIDADLLPKADYFRLEKEIDAMMQGLYFKAKKSKRPFKDVIDDYLDTQPISKEEKEDILNLWRRRRKALSLPVFENEKEVMDYTIYLDMDGVLVDFDKQFEELTGMAPSAFEAKNGSDEFWEAIDGAGVGFWRGMKWMPGGEALYNRASQAPHFLLSSPSRSDVSKIGKHLWRRDKTPSTKLILARSYNKKNYANPSSILIDDRESNINQWREAGGIGILYTSAEQVNRELDKLGL